jgi:hypothetical protein
METSRPNGRSLEREDHLHLAQVQIHDRPVAQRLDPVNHGQREKECKHGKSGHADEHDIHGAVDALAGTAMLAFFEVMFVVGAHLRRDAGNVISPTGQYVANHWIRAGCHKYLLRFH